jgi:nitrite reductase (NADH) large subunit
METVVVVGNGMVGHRFCERLRERAGGDRFAVVCFGEEPRPAYDRVHLSDCFAGRTAPELALADREWYAARDITLVTGECIVAVDRGRRVVRAASGREVAYDVLVLATGSAPFVPPVPGITIPGVFVYRTIEDVDAICGWAVRAQSAAVIGGGLLGLEAAKAMRDLGLETHVVEFAPRLMPRQVDAAGGDVLRRTIELLGVRVHLGMQTAAVLGETAVEGLRFADGGVLAADMVVVSAGIRPRDELARAAGLAVGERGGIVVGDDLHTSDPAVLAIGECAIHRGTIYGLVGPGYQMADVAAARLCGEDVSFAGADLSTRLKLLGVEVASFGQAFADEDATPAARRVVFEDRVRGVYQKLVVTQDCTRLIGGILVGDARPYSTLLTTLREERAIPENPAELLFATAMPAAAGAALAEDGQVCSCNAVTAGAIRAAVDGGCASVAEVKATTRAGTGCGGCTPFVVDLVERALAARGQATKRVVCEHFPYTRQELFQIVKINRLESFDAVLASHGTGSGCEICRPAVASILASTWNDFVLNHPTIQDTNDRFLANIQRGGTYSIVPRVPGGEITPEKLIALGKIARRFDLYCKITGGQRIDLLGARVDQLPDVWEALIEAGFESGHAYGKAMRTVKSCVGTTWCRYGVQDSVGLAIRLEERYRGIRAPHKLKSGVSGCIRECAEAQGKDFGVIATEKGWNLYLCGNGGSKPRHADLFAADVDEETVVRLIDRFLMYYIHTANPLERTARWLERMDGGIEYLRRVLIDDALGICTQLEADMARLVASYECEWKAVVRDPQRRSMFKVAVNAPHEAPALGWTVERGQRRPADWPAGGVAAAFPHRGGTWVHVAQVDDVPHDGGTTYMHGGVPIAVFHFASRGAWYATQAVCPHRGDAVLGRGLLGSQGGVPKVACPLHKKTFSLETGQGLSDPSLCVRTFPVEVREDGVWVQLPTLGAGERAPASPADDEAAACPPA